VSADLSRTKPGEEDNLLVEAVSLLVQRQQDTEKWVTEQVCQVDERTAATERRYAELEARLAAIEEQLARLAHELEPTRGEGATDDRLARLREQLESLKAAGDGRPEVAAQPVPRPPSEPPRATAVREPDASQPPEARSAAQRQPRRPGLPPGDGAPEHQSRIPIPPEWRQRVASPAVKEPTRAGAAAPRRASLLDLLGSNPQDRFGLVFMGVGAVAVLYAALSLLRAG
jgi:hypothetical protein